MVKSVKPAIPFDEEEWGKLPGAKDVQEAGEQQKRKRGAAAHQKSPSKPAQKQRKNSLPTDDDLSEVYDPNPKKARMTTVHTEAEQCVAHTPSYSGIILSLLKHRPCHQCAEVSKRCLRDSSGPSASFSCVRCKRNNVECSFRKEFDDFVNPPKKAERITEISTPQDIQKLGVPWPHDLVMYQILLLRDELKELGSDMGTQLEILESRVGPGRSSSYEA